MSSPHRRSRCASRCAPSGCVVFMCRIIGNGWGGTITMYLPLGARWNSDDFPANQRRVNTWRGIRTTRDIAIHFFSRTISPGIFCRRSLCAKAITRDDYGQAAFGYYFQNIWPRPRTNYWFRWIEFSEDLNSLETAEVFDATLPPVLDHVHLRVRIVPYWAFGTTLLLLPGSGYGGDCDCDVERAHITVATFAATISARHRNDALNAERYRRKPTLYIFPRDFRAKCTLIVRSTCLAGELARRGLLATTASKLAR